MSIEHEREKAAAYALRGDALLEAGRCEEAAAIYERALGLVPDSHGVLNNRGIALFALGRHEQALASYDRAVMLDAGYADAHYNRANALRELGRLEEAVASYDAALGLKPHHLEALNNRGNVLRELRRHREALASFDQAIDADNRDALALYNRGNILNDLGRIDEAAASYRQALTIWPHVPQIHNALIFAVARTATQCVDIFEQAKAFGAQFEPGIARLSHRNSRDADRRLKVGYVSGDFREHAVAYYFGPVLENHDKASVEVFCYSNHPRVDAVTRRFMEHADHWRSLVGLSDDDAAALVQRDAIDVLVDLSGHTGYNRLLVFARKPAPVQVTWMGFPCTTGLAAMDYRLTNGDIDPEGVTDAYHTETLVRLPGLGCYEPSGLPEVSELPALANGCVTFVSFNDVTKVSMSTYRTWAKILSRVPSARLMLVCDAPSSAHAREILMANGVDAARLTFSDKLPFADYLALHGSVDLALDTFPYNGETTTRMALWMGVPVVTVPGNTPLSRAGYALEAGVGLHAFIAQDEQEYEEIAVRWATDLPALAEVRRTLRSRLRAAPMTNAKLGTRDVEAAYRRMWQTWCKSASEPAR